MRKDEKKVTPKMTVKELLDQFPETAFLFMNRKMLCVGCPAEAFVSLEDVAESYQIDLDEIVNEIKQIINKRKCQQI